MKPHHVLPLEWSEARGIARQACARIFRDGGKPVDALVMFGIPKSRAMAADWSNVVDRVAEHLCTMRSRRAA